MALVSLRQVLDHAAEHGYGVPAFNVNNLEQIQAIMEAAQETQSPVILQAPAVCQQSIRSGFTSVMMDGSSMPDAKTPASYDYNVEVTRKVCEFSHSIGVSVEGELGCLGSLETGEAGEEDGVGAQGKLTHDMLLSGSSNPPGDAWIVQRSAGVVGNHPQVRRRDQRDVRCAGRGNPARHPQRRAQDQHRH